jgi:hypothetical protein
VITNRWLIGIVAAVVALAAVVLSVLAPVAVGVSTAAPTAPPWEPDGNAGAPWANVVFYDASGNQVTSGTDLTTPFAYAVATTAADPGSGKAIMYFANPKFGQPPVPADWTNTPESGTTTFSPSSSLPANTPANVKAYAPVHPVVVATANITTWLQTNIPDTNPGYANTIQVRVQDTQVFSTTTYWDTDIGYNTTASPITVDGTTVPAHGWAQLFPFVTATTTTLSSTLTSPQPAGTNIPLKATVAPATAGTVQFYDGPTALGAPVAVTAGTANFTDSRPPAVGAHNYTAVFSPNLGDETGTNTANATIVDQSTSSALPFTINAAGTPTTTTLASSQNPSMTGQQVTYTATVAPTPDAGTVAFSDGGTVINACAAEAVTAGTATCAITYTTLVTHTITAAYSGDSNFGASHTASPVSQLVTGVRGVYHALTPVRITDTRTNSGLPNAGHHLVAGVPLNIQVEGAGGVASGAAAAVLNVTVTNPTQLGFLTVWPTGSPRPTASNLNFVAKQTVPNLVEVGLGTNGQVSVFSATGTVDVIVDVEGYTAPLSTAGQGLYNPLTPARITDTRNNSGQPNAGHHLVSGVALNVQVTGAGGVPGSPGHAGGVAAVALNVTVTNPTKASFLTVWPTSPTPPTASNLNFTAGETVPNRVIVPVNQNGQVSIINGAGTADVIVDVAGYFTDASNPAATGVQFTPISPVRITDTRPHSGLPNAGQTLGPRGTLPIQVTGASGIPTTGVVATVLNVTVTNATQLSFLTVWPQGVTMPNASDLNWTKGTTIPNVVVVKLGTTGEVSVFNFAGTVDVIVDASGWYS